MSYLFKTIIFSDEYKTTKILEVPACLGTAKRLKTQGIWPSGRIRRTGQSMNLEFLRDPHSFEDQCVLIMPLANFDRVNHFFLHPTNDLMGDISVPWRLC